MTYRQIAQEVEKVIQVNEMNAVFFDRMLFLSIRGRYSTSYKKALTGGPNLYLLIDKFVLKYGDRNAFTKIIWVTILETEIAYISSRWGLNWR